MNTEGPPPRRVSLPPGLSASVYGPLPVVPDSIPPLLHSGKYSSHISSAPNQPIGHQPWIAAHPSTPQLSGRLGVSSKPDLPRGPAPMPPRGPPPRGPPPRGPPPLPHGPPGHYLGRPSVLGKFLVSTGHQYATSAKESLSRNHQNPRFHLVNISVVHPYWVSQKYMNDSIQLSLI